MPFDRPSLLRGVRDMTALFIAVVPFALVIGITIVETGLPRFAGWASGWLIFAGAAQFTAVSLLGTGAGPVAAASAALIINSRHVMYSAALVPRFRTQPRWFQWLGPYVLVDQVFALGTGNVDAGDVEWRSYYLGAGGFAWMAWQLTMGVGILIGPVLPDGLDLTFAIPAMFLGLLVVGIRSKAGAVAAVVGAVVTGALWQFGNGGGLLVGSIAGSVAGYLVDRRSDR